MSVTTKPSDRERALHWARRYKALRREWLIKKELMDSVTGYDFLGDVHKRIGKLYMQFNAEARGDTRDLDGDEISWQEKWNNLVGATAICMARAVANARWAVNEHARNERLTAALQACWDEYEELMPDALREQAKVALGIREFTVSPVDEGTS